jgi:predicted nucleic acid-binding protein
MILVDANLLLYAYDAGSPQHEAARSWWEERLSQPQLVRLAWTRLWLSFASARTRASMSTR